MRQTSAIGRTIRLRRTTGAVVAVVVAVTVLAVGPAGADHLADTSRVSVDSAGNDSNGGSYSPSVSADGTVVAYHSDATNLVDGDSNGVRDVFVFDTVTGVTTRVSVDTNGDDSNGGSYSPSVSADGTVVAYESLATNLVVGDTNGFRDVFVYDTVSGVTTRVSVDSDGTEANGDSYSPSVSADGTVVAYHSSASNLVDGDGNGFSDVFVYDIGSGITTRVSVDTDGNEGNANSFGPAVSADGTVVAYYSDATNLVADDGNIFRDVFVYDIGSGITTRVSVDTDGDDSNEGSFYPSVSADGTVVAYESDASDLVAGDTNAKTDVFVYDIGSGTTTRVSVDTDGNDSNEESYAPSVSADGTVVAYESLASDLVAGDTNAKSDVFVYDTATGITTRVSVHSDGTEGNGSSVGAAVSADGTVVAYSSVATNLVGGDTNAASDVFVWTVDVTPTAEGVVASVAEDAVSGVVVGTVVGSDSHGETVGFVITAGDGDGLFAIDPDSGAVTVAGPLDYETAVQHVLTVGVSDATHTVEVTVTINVTDVGGPLDVVVDPTADTFGDDDGSTFEADIEWIAAAGITLGCNPDGTLYCPNLPVTRAQMASFLVRALNLPAVTGNRFGDVSGTHLANINALAEAGVTLGCNPDGTLYCPADPVSRAQMGSFLARALGLAPIPGNVFADVSGVHEPNINAIADAGITLGCNPEGTLYCPNDPVTRGQMAAFLHRALG